ncbi:hypothetical protein MLD38_039012 [Melastoma candidum]|uniref:Uncharacterized protein n=1 Tax=Melastoma candidum TaxID=119954 RepID=A0ACB9L0Q8_9MYRT|nr:hypothetical protein MLD38_039012 [Melastoma candidum]
MMLCNVKVVQDAVPSCITSEMEKFSSSDEGGNSHSFSSGDHSARGTSGYSAFGRDWFEYSRMDSGTSGFSEQVDKSSSFGEPSPMNWPCIKSGRYNPAVLSGMGLKQPRQYLDENLDNGQAVVMELETMRERFSKLLLGEDMSGSGKGVCTALTISNAITNLYATVFGQNLKLEPLNREKKAMWQREMNCLLSVCEYIVEFVPTLQALPDETLVEVMSSRPRTDISINLPALRQLDALLLETLDSFQDTEFWYAEHGSMSGNSTRWGSFRRVVIQRKDEKWWLPVPCVNPGGLSEKLRKQLQQKRDCAKQIHKAAMAINSAILDEMDMPDSYMASLPKSGRAKVGYGIYKFMNSSNEFLAENLLDGLKLISEHEALDLADRVEAAMYTWRRKACVANSKSSWAMVKVMAETGRADKNYILAERAESLLFSLKQRSPGLSQTSLDTSKIQFNKDVGQAILESYSRVLEGLAFNIVAWIEDVLHIDRTMRN